MPIDIEEGNLTEVLIMSLVVSMGYLVSLVLNSQASLGTGCIVIWVSLDRTTEVSQFVLLARLLN